MTSYTQTHTDTDGGPHRVAVLGAGVMGRQLAALLANAGLQVDLLDIVPPDAPPNRRSILAETAIRALTRMDPSPIVSARVLDRIRPGNMEDDWDRALTADWILEAVVERLDVKQQIFARLDVPELAARWVTTNTSGLSIHAMVEDRSPSFTARFFCALFFNPPRYLPLVEVIPHRNTDPARLQALAGWLLRRLGKRIVRAKDTPNFIANRFGVWGTLATIRLMQEMDLSIEEVDALTGPLLDRPRTATFRTLDLVGLDIFAHTVETLRSRAVEDECHAWFVVPDWIVQLIEMGALGRKTQRGIYWRRDGERLVFDPVRGDYRSARRPNWPWMERVRREPDLRTRLDLLRQVAPHYAEFLERLTAYGCIYAARRVPEIADRISDVDGAIRWGFNWRKGPFQVWDELGDERILRYVGELPDAPMPPLDARRAAAAATFYREGNGRVLVLDLTTRTYQPVPEWFVSPVVIIRRHRPVVARNPGATLVDLGDDVFALLLHPSGNAIGVDVLEMCQRALDHTRKNGAGLVITGTRDHFSYGANLALLITSLQNRDIAQLDWTIRTFQQTTRAFRNAPFPVVVAVHGMVLGGGCEFMLYADRVVAPMESYIGLVELGAGLIPAGGGCCEVIRRAQTDVDMTERVAPWVHYLDKLRGYFIHIGRAEVSRSAVEAREWGYLREEDIIIPDADHRLDVAKQVVRELATDYVPPDEPPLWVLGEDGRAVLSMAVHLMHRGGYITDYEKFLGEQLARVLTGGDLPHPTRVSVEYILDLERKTFLSLCKQPKTYERIAHILAYRRPLRN